MAATLKEKVKKIASTLTNGHAEDETPVTYFIDEYMLREWEREINPALESGNILLNTLKMFYPAETTLEFFAAMKNPFQFYTTKHKITHQEAFEREEALGIEYNLKAPKGFESVIDAAMRAKRYFENKDPEYFEIRNGEIQLTDKYYNRRNAKCYQTAATPEEKELLRFCQSVIESLEKLEPILARDPKNAEAIKLKKYALPLPYFLKIVRTPSGTKLIPSPVFVKEGFAGTAHLGRYIATAREKKLAMRDRIPNLGERWVKFQKQFGVGDWREYMVLEKDYEKKHKNINTRLLPGLWNSQGKTYGTPLEFREASWKTPPTGKFEN